MSITRTILQCLPIPQLPGYESRLVKLEYPPGCKAHLHSHPVPATGYVVEGEVVSQWEGGQLEYYKQGDTFVDMGITPHLRSDDTSDEKPLVMILSYVIRVEEPNVQVVSGLGS